ITKVGQNGLLRAGNPDQAGSTGETRYVASVDGIGDKENICAFSLQTLANPGYSLHTRPPKWQLITVFSIPFMETPALLRNWQKKNPIWDWGFRLWAGNTRQRSRSLCSYSYVPSIPPANSPSVGDGCA